MTADTSSHGVARAQDLTSSSPEPVTSAVAELALDPHILQHNSSTSSFDGKDQPDLPEIERKTVYYLAYGSNLSSATFQGHRGIHPLSATPVHVPSLSLCFNLAGIAYLEPCMANVCLRDEAALHEPALNTAVAITAISETAPLLQAFSSSSSSASYSSGDPPAWDKGLIGVLYEVTPEDYAKIWATEGGGSSYQDVVVPCYPLPPKSEYATAAPNTTPIKAHTLFASDPRLLRSHDPQPSLRYLNILRTGAREHELPQPYVAYLDALQHYEATTWRQKIGKLIWGAMWVPLVFGTFALANVFKEEDGSHPRWIKKCQEAIFRTMWRCYDSGYKQIFGDGERRVAEGERTGRYSREKGVWRDDMV